MEKVANKIAAIQMYIHLVKGVQIEVALPRSQREYQLLTYMSNIASKWLVWNKNEVELLKRFKDG
jgi:hypothetical protein